MNVDSLANGLKAVFGTSVNATGTNFASIPTLKADNTPGGHISPSDLASVLGGIQKKGSISNDINIDNISETCVYSVSGIEIVQNLEWYGVLFTIKTGATSGYPRLQVFFTASVNSSWCYRVLEDGTWKQWKVMTPNT